MLASEVDDVLNSRSMRRPEHLRPRGVVGGMRTPPVVGVAPDDVNHVVAGIGDGQWSKSAEGTIQSRSTSHPELEAQSRRFCTHNVDDAAEGCLEFLSVRRGHVPTPVFEIAFPANADDRVVAIVGFEVLSNLAPHSILLSGGN